MTAHDFGALKKQGLRVTVDVHALDDDGVAEFDQATMTGTLQKAVDRAIATMLTGSYATSLKVTRIVG